MTQARPVRCHRYARPQHAAISAHVVLIAMVGAVMACSPFACVIAAETSAVDTGHSDVPAWVFPLNADAATVAAPYDNVKPLHVPNSRVTFTEAALNDLFDAPDWHPASHGAMPSIVAHGRPPDVYACGYCHTPGGQGRPENASLAGLPATYIMNQVADFKSGERKSAWRGPYRPADRMIHAVTYASDEELSAAAEYFSTQTLRRRVVVAERARVPRSRVVGWVYAADKGGGNELIAERLLEFAPDEVRHENRDDEMRYIAYVPPGSIGRGRRIVQQGADIRANACTSCHGPQLRGVGSVPPIAGRSPTYILRQLLAFQSGARSGTSGVPMRAVVKDLTISRMIDVAAYAASLPP
jgi:cytochrome c553